ncbi:MAG TPA: DUF2846 domain-containing protein [Candidatus Acidoferrales bacterium]
MSSRIPQIAARFLIAAFFLAVPATIVVHAQDNQDAATLARSAGCGAGDVGFSVKTDKNQHPTPQPAPGKAIVYVFNTVRTDPGFNIGTVTLRVGLDGDWVGANHGDSYFYFQVDPGDHRICAQWQSQFERVSKLASALSLSAQPGQVYYVRAIADARSRDRYTVRLEPLDPAEALLLSANSGYSTSHPKK